MIRGCVILNHKGKEARTQHHEFIVGLRAKGSNSRRLTEKYGLDRYSLNVEFDHFAYGSYYGLDKFSQDSSFQDDSYLKAWITYDMMNHIIHISDAEETCKSRKKSERTT